MDIKVLYEDNHLIAAYKPAGVLVQKGEGPEHDDDTLYWQVKMFLKERDQKPGNVFLGVLHRLDRVVSGIVLFAKTSKGAARLSEQIRERTITKIYHAVVEGHVDLEESMLIDTIRKDSGSIKAIVGGDASIELGNEAVLYYWRLQSNQKYSLLKIQLETGRFHQIRAQLSAIGHPIVGDVKYGASEALTDRSIMLCATELHFKTATSDENIKISIEIPAEFEQILG
ncbi:MAG: RluA family pseudouridine synthase [Patescibacteria group bacterium]